MAEGVLNKRNGGEEGMKKINSLSFKGSQPSEKKKEGRKRTAGSRGGVVEVERGWVRREENKWIKEF